MVVKRAKSSARDRIVATAEKLFYAEGVRAVGIDRIIAEAEVAKMTLYNHFSSKDELILAVLKYREENINGFFTKEIERFSKQGMDRLDAFFSALKSWFSSKGFRGCAFINASVELADRRHPASKFAAEHKHRFHEMLTEIITDAAGVKAAKFAPAVSLMVEGAIVTAVMEGDPSAADVARDAAIAMLPKRRTTK